MRREIGRFRCRAHDAVRESDGARQHLAPGARHVRLGLKLLPVLGHPEGFDELTLGDLRERAL